MGVGFRDEMKTGDIGLVFSTVIWQGKKSVKIFKRSGHNEGYPLEGL